MLDAALAIEEFLIGRSYAEYLANRMFRGAVERHIEIIGEAARRISDATKSRHPEVPWQSIIGQRNVLAQEYDEILHEAIWMVATKRVPLLIPVLREMLSAAEND